MKHILGPNSKSIITNVQEGDAQPNALDLRLDKVFSIGDDLFEISDDHKRMRTTVEILPDDEGYFNLEIGSYEVVMSNQIGLSETESGWVITRSTLNRSNIFISSGLYDSFYGYNATTGEFVGGVMAGCMHVGSGPARIKKGTRVGQFLMFDAEALHKYDGSYGNHKEHDKKYQG